MIENKISVSIVIVCMNNLTNLYPCLDSIKKYTTVSYETLVVAYLFSVESLQKLQADYPWITIIESNEIRGFSENNNLALRQAKGEYCFVLNDDTNFDQPVIDQLVKTFKKLPENTAIVSPKTLNQDRSVQCCGRPKYNSFTFLMVHLRILRIYEKVSQYTNKNGIFRTYNILGACFLIKTDVFRSLGWFDEKYFFCPEDIALSTLANERGFKCYINADIELIHYGGGTWSKIQSATMPASVKGCIIFYSRDKLINTVFNICQVIFFRSLYVLYWLIKKNIYNDEKSNTLLEANKNTIAAVFSSKTPKEIFIQFYATLKQMKMI